MKYRLLHIIILPLMLAAVTTTYADKVSVKIYSTDEAHKYLGTVTAKDTKKGLLLMPQLKGLPPGEHGFHIHVNNSCADSGMAAGGHLDPEKTDKHLGPYNKAGHLGDLPILTVNSKGVANTPELAPRLTVADIKKHALMIHLDGDNYSDNPKPLGGGGPRLACGVIP
jgi:Cu-Zn family superoxide dismutase